MNKLTLALFTWLAFGMHLVTYADDYVLDPAPTESVMGYIENYHPAGDKEVCSLYLENLQYFAQRNKPLSCGQPIAPYLKSRIQIATWEDLNPEHYSELFNAIIKSVRTYGKEPSAYELGWWRNEVKQGDVVFRRLKFDLKGNPKFHGEPNAPTDQIEFTVVQYGNDVTNTKIPNETWRCRSVRERKMNFTGQAALSLFVVTKDLRQIYGRLEDWKGYSGQNLWVINGALYGELYDDNGDVKLSELDITNHVVHLEPICLYRHVQTSHN